MLLLLKYRLRGAISVALALSFTLEAEQGQTNLSSFEAERLFFYVGIVAALTLLINGTMAEFVLQLLNLSEDNISTPSLEVMKQNTKRRLMESVYLQWLEVPELHKKIVLTRCQFFNELDEFCTSIGVNTHTNQNNNNQNNGNSTDNNKLSLRLQTPMSPYASANFADSIDNSPASPASLKSYNTSSSAANLLFPTSSSSLSSSRNSNALLSPTQSQLLNSPTQLVPNNSTLTSSRTLKTNNNNNSVNNNSNNNTADIISLGNMNNNRATKSGKRSRQSIVSEIQSLVENDISTSFAHRNSTRNLIESKDNNNNNNNPSQLLSPTKSILKGSINNMSSTNITKITTIKNPTTTANTTTGTTAKKRFSINVPFSGNIFFKPTTTAADDFPDDSSVVGDESVHFYDDSSIAGNNLTQFCPFLSCYNNMI